MRSTRAEIHTADVLSNLRFIRARIGDQPKIMAIVKANAYGHGLEIIANAAVKSGDVFAFGVATEEEGVYLRKVTGLPILVLTTVLADGIETLIRHDLDFTLSDPSLIPVIASRARALGKNARVHLKVDTGMRRVGIKPESSLEILNTIHEYRELNLIGLSTHFATSDEADQTFFRRQLSEFEDVARAVRTAGIHVPLVHAANSGAILQLPKESAFDMVRPGIMLYGYTPSAALDSSYGQALHPALELVSSVAYAKRIGKGDGVSYNLTWKATRDTNILTIPAGYGDGYFRAYSNKSEVMIRGKRYPVVGTICMDQMMVDSGDDVIPAGEPLTLLSRKRGEIDAWNLAALARTIPYEILTSIAARVPRIEIPN